MVKVKWDTIGHGPRKKIDSRTYRRRCQTNSRGTGKEIADRLRQHGYLARISRQLEDKVYPWAVYYREKTKYRKEPGYGRSSGRSRRRKK